ncbi:SOS response-associated peptidase [Reichenbachiella agariperforans]|uniref:SOS response-associated peptidase n=1 Tax=Reichenbachiella agariperforans TaxID=156994 RepID=UPI001C085380|nr:SOS response-associated peptidase [Reichenbachiella agariperforans]MBU2912709.1 SOS response-associated peptidase [Reichenbachiella agariperforans]
MCYHSKQTQNATKIEKRFKAKLADPKEKALVTSSHWNGYDFPKTPIITNLDPGQIQLYHWGLIPSWADDESIRQVTLNAKIETLDEKASFKEHASHRCLVLANGFYEWQWLDSKGKRKQKYEVGIEGDAPFAFAGVWSEWVDTGSGEVVHSYAIVTTEAQHIMRDIHNTKLRMPVVLRPEQEKAWLSGDDKDNYIDTGVELFGRTENLQLGLF